MIEEEMTPDELELIRASLAYYHDAFCEARDGAKLVDPSAYAELAEAAEESAALAMKISDIMEAAGITFD